MLHPDESITYISLLHRFPSIWPHPTGILGINASFPRWSVTKKCFNSWRCRGSERHTPRCDSMVCGLFWTKGNPDPVGSRETSVSLALSTVWKNLNQEEPGPCSVKSRNGCLPIYMITQHRPSLQRPTEAPGASPHPRLRKSHLPIHMNVINLDVFFLLISLKSIWSLD